MPARRKTAVSGLLIGALILGMVGLGRAEEGDKSPGQAALLSVAGTLLPWGLLALAAGSGGMGREMTEGMTILALAGIIFGPSTGFFYGGLPGRGWAGAGIRFAGLAACLAGWGLAWDGSASAGVALGAVGSLVFLGSTLFDDSSVAGRVKARNADRRRLALSLAPILAPARRTYGLSLRAAF